MRKFLSLALIFGAVFCAIQTNAQSNKSFTDTSATFEHFVGLQANALIQQVFNFGKSEELSNPFVAKYTLKHVDTGLSFNVAGGLNRNTTTAESGLLTQNESYDLRVGLGWQKSLSERIEFGVGADILFGRTFNESSTINTVVFNGGVDSTVTVIRNKSTYFGYGAQLSLSYKLTPSILIGTEASCYAYSTEVIDNSTIDNYFIRSISDQATSVRSIITENATTDGEEIELNLPIVFFLILRF
ncbi:MAG: hypothetical protein WBG42_08155 [Cryomorphaceae bacterium]